jgi:hypothetical protein
MSKLLQYAQSLLLRAQRWRARVTVALCDCECIQLFEVTREMSEPVPALQLRVYPIASLTDPVGANALAHLIAADAEALVCAHVRECLHFVLTWLLPARLATPLCRATIVRR